MSADSIPGPAVNVHYPFRLEFTVGPHDEVAEPQLSAAMRAAFAGVCHHVPPVLRQIHAVRNPELGVTAAPSYGISPRPDGAGTGPRPGPVRTGAGPHERRLGGGLYGGGGSPAGPQLALEGGRRREALGGAEMEALGVVGADRAEHVERVGVLDAFGDRALVQAAGDPDDRLDDLVIELARGQLADEAPCRSSGTAPGCTSRT